MKQLAGPAEMQRIGKREKQVQLMGVHDLSMIYGYPQITRNWLSPIRFTYLATIIIDFIAFFAILNV